MVTYTGADFQRMQRLLRRYIQQPATDQLEGDCLFRHYSLLQEQMAEAEGIATVSLNGWTDDREFGARASTCLTVFRRFLLGLDPEFFRELASEPDLDRPLVELAETVAAGHQPATQKEG